MVYQFLTKPPLDGVQQANGIPLSPRQDLDRSTPRPVPLSSLAVLGRFEAVLSFGWITVPSTGLNALTGQRNAKFGRFAVGRAATSTKAHSPASKIVHRRGQYSVSLFILPPL